MSNDTPTLNKKHLKILENSKREMLQSDSIDSLLDNKMTFQNDLNFSEPTNLHYIGLRKHVSYSEIATWMDCSHRHKLKYLDEIKVEGDGPSENTEYGQVIHDALEEFLKTRKMPSVDSLKSQLTQMFSALPNAEKLKEADWHDTIEPVLSEVPAFMDETFGSDWEYIAAEYPLMETIERHEHMFKGFIDGIIKAKNKKGEEVVWIIDWKGQRLSAPILTPDGWVTMGSLKIGDKITGSDGKPTSVTGIYPLGQREVYKLTMRDGSVVECTDDHLWKVYSAGGERSKVLMTKDLIDNKEYKYLPVISGPVIYNQQFEPKINPYILGLMLGDGSLTKNHTCTFTTIDETLIQRIVQLAPSNWEIKKCAGSNRTPSYRLNGSKKDFENLGLLGHRSWEKFIPEEYKFGSPDQRLDLLRGLLDTDGWVQKGIAKLSTTSEQLAKDVKDIVGSLGGVAFIGSRKKKRNESEKVEYIVTVRLPKGMKPFTLDRKLSKFNENQYHKLWRTISKIEIVDKDEMQCIKVAAEDQLYVTSDFIVTHNTCSYFWPLAKRIDPKKTMQLAFYKYFYSRKFNLPLTKVKCGFVLLRRSKKKGNCELVTVSVGDKAVEKAMGTIDNMLGYIQKKMFPKNRENCKYCPYAGTEHCP